MSVYGRILLAGLGSALLLLAALGFQYLGGLQPCAMCIWQRWPHAAAAAISLLAITVLWRQRRALSGAGAITVSIGAGIGAWHFGVERGWLPGPGACSSAMDPASMTTEELMALLEVTQLVRCDEVVWDFLNVSMAGWNALISSGLALLWILSALSKTATRHGAPSAPSR